MRGNGGGWRVKNSLISYAVKDRLLEYIHETGRGPGEMLPSERALCKELGFNRNTFRAVVREMVNTGELTRGDNARYYVPRPRLRINLWDFNSFSRTMLNQGLQMERRMLAADLIEADRWRAKQLEVPAGTKLYMLKRLALVEGEPIVVEESNLIASVCRGLLKFDFAKESLYRVLREEYGVQLKNQYIEIATQGADFWEATLLGIPEGDPLIVDYGYAHDEEGRLIELSITKAVADRYEFEGYAGKEGDA